MSGVQFFKEEGKKLFILDLWQLFEAIEHFVRFVNYVLEIFVETFWCLHKKQLIDGSIQKYSFHIYLINIEIIKGCNCKENSKDHKFYYYYKSLIKVNTILL